MQAIFSSFPKLTPISGLPHQEQFPNGTEKVNKYSFLQDLSCLFELYLEPLQKETFLTQDEVREYLKKVLVILLWAKTLTLGFFLLLRVGQKKQTTKMSTGMTPVSAFLSGVCITSFS